MPVFVPLDRVLDSPYNARRHYDPEAVAQLADSIEREGMLQAPVGRLVVNGEGLPLPSVGNSGGPHELYRMPLGPPVGEGSDGGKAALHYLSKLSFGAPADVQLALGHRRARAWRLIWERRLGDLVTEAEGVHGVPVGCMPVELEPLSDEQMFARGVAENRHRRDVSGVEEAEAMHAAEKNFGWTHEAIGQRFGYSRSAVSNKLRLLKLPADVRELNVEGLLPERTARALVAMYDLDPELREFAGPDSLPGDLHQLAGEEVRFLLEDGWTHEGIATKVRSYVDAVKTVAARARREREPMIFHERTASEPAPEADVAVENIDRNPEAGDYDDGGQQLRAVAEAQGLEPFDAEAEREAESGESAAAVEGDTLATEHEPATESALSAAAAKAYEEGRAARAAGADGFQNPYHWKTQSYLRKMWNTGFASADTRDSANEPWDEFDLAVDAALAELSPEARRVLTPVLWPEGFHTGKTAGRWRDSGAWRDLAMDAVRDALIDHNTPQQAAEALGLEVEWPDVSAETLGGDERPYTHAAVVEQPGSDDDFVVTVWGLGTDADDAMRDGRHHTDETLDVHPCSERLAAHVEAEGGECIDVHLDSNGVLQLGPVREARETDDAPPHSDTGGHEAGAAVAAKKKPRPFPDGLVADHTGHWVELQNYAAGRFLYAGTPHDIESAERARGLVAAVREKASARAADAKDLREAWGEDAGGNPIELRSDIAAECDSLDLLVAEGRRVARVLEKLASKLDEAAGDGVATATAPEVAAGA